MHSKRGLELPIDALKEGSTRNGKLGESADGWYSVEGIRVR